MESVVITGVGVCTPRGQNAAELWGQITRPENSLITHPDSTHNPSPNQVHQAQELAEKASIEALKEAGLWDMEQLTQVDANRVGCTFSASKPLFTGKGAEVNSPEVINHLLRKRLGLHGESRNVVAACATGAYAASMGASWIEQGLCDVVLAGSVEPPAHPLIEAGFKRMGVISKDRQMQPFDRNRSGFVLSAGAGAVILESESHARSRGATWHARLSGWGWGADGHSAVAFNSNGSRIAEVIQKALARARLDPQEIGYINAHGTATRLNDWIETQSLIKAFGHHSDRLMVSATKASTGHMLGAAGSVELVITVQALLNQFIPPTSTLDDPDPKCPLDYTPHQGHPATFGHALTLSFGFGGPIGALVVSRD